MKKSTSNDSASSIAIYTLPKSDVAVMFETIEQSPASVFRDPKGLEFGKIPLKNGNEGPEYVKWGNDNQLPYNAIRLIESDEVLSENKLFNLQVCFGQGIRIYDKETGKPTTNDEIIDFMDESNIQMFFAGIIQDMKYFFWCFSVVCLDGNGKITSLRRLPVENVRLGRADKNGIITKAYFANWRDEAGPLMAEDIQEFEVLNMYAPWKDLAIRMGKERSPEDGKLHEPTNDRMFGIICRFPVPGSRYYPVPTYASVFLDDWLEIKKMTQKRLRAAIKNTNSIRYHVEIMQKYWVDLWRRKGVLGNMAKEKEVQDAEYKRITEFLSDSQSAGKALVSEYAMDVSGKESHNIKINVIDTQKQGGEWSDEITEACNMLCYADGIHPNLIGAVPGKTQVNNSGSDKRELFTMKQAMEDIWHESMMAPFMTVLRHNNWHKEVGIDVPIIQLTTLDNHLDAVNAVKTNDNN